MPALSHGNLTRSRTQTEPIREAVDRLADVLPEREDVKVLIDFLEDDLREGLEAIGDIEAHFTDILDTLRADRVSPIKLLDCADDFRTLQKLEYLSVVVSHLRRRLGQAAGKLKNG